MSLNKDLFDIAVFPIFFISLFYDKVIENRFDEMRQKRLFFIHSRQLFKIELKLFSYY